VLGDFDARERISRHQQEEKIEKRDVGTGAFAGLVVPQFLTVFGGAVRSRRTSVHGCLTQARPT
jgi:hypothetical protein